MTATAAAERPDRPLWDYSVRVYGRPGVTDACIALQDDYGLDVNVLLLCLWSGQEGPGPLDRRALDLAMSAVWQWQRDVVRPLRSLRRLLTRNGPPAGPEQRQRVRQLVAEAELASEAVEQDLLAAALVPAEPGLEPGGTAGGGQPAAAETRSQVRWAGANLVRYLERAGVAASPSARAHLVALLASAAGCDPGEAEASLA